MEVISDSNWIAFEALSCICSKRSLNMATCDKTSSFTSFALNWIFPEPPPSSTLIVSTDLDSSSIPISKRSL